MSKPTKSFDVKIESVQVISAQWDLSGDSLGDISVQIDLELSPTDETGSRLIFGSVLTCSAYGQEIIKISVRVFAYLPDRSLDDLNDQPAERNYLIGLFTELTLGQSRSLILMASQMSGRAGTIILPTLLESGFFEQAVALSDDPQATSDG